MPDHSSLTDIQFTARVLVLAILLWVLIDGARYALTAARAREAEEARIDAKWQENEAELDRLEKRVGAFYEAMARAIKDGACEVCGASQGLRFAVSLYDDAAVCCANCAPLLKGVGR